MIALFGLGVLKVLKTNSDTKIRSAVVNWQPIIACFFNHCKCNSSLNTVAQTLSKTTIPATNASILIKNVSCTKFKQMSTFEQSIFQNL
jgi:hypothetical protein